MPGEITKRQPNDGFFIGGGGGLGGVFQCIIPQYHRCQRGWLVGFRKVFIFTFCKKRYGP